MRLIFLLLLLGALNIHAQTVLSIGDAKNEALGSLVSVTTGEWALWRNPAGLASVQQPIVSSSIRKSQSVNASTRAGMLSFPLKFGSAAVGVSSFGDDIYNESTGSLGFANCFGLASIGVRTDINQLRIDGNSTRRAFGISIGCIAKITQRLSVGIAARNVNLPVWSHGQPLPIILNTGISYTATDNFLVVAEVEKNTDFKPTFKGGFEYSLQKKFFVRTGFNLYPNAAFGGFGLRMWRFGADYSLKFQYLTGYAQQLSIGLRFKK